MPSKISPNFIHAADVQRVFTVLDQVGGGYIVGGAVRDSVVGREPKDIDFATPASPDVVTKAFEEAGHKTVPTGIEYGVVTAVINGNPFEVTTFRRDVECDGRRAVTAWGASLEEDAQRRDLTMNALYADRDGVVIDPTGGLGDLRARRIRFVGDAETRIREDRLRAFRMFRFWSRFGDPDPEVHEEAIKAAALFAGDFSAVSRERIGAEMSALLMTADPRPQIREMARSGIWADAVGAADHGLIIELIGKDIELGEKPSLANRMAPLGPDTIKTLLKLPKALSITSKNVSDAIAWDDPARAAFTYGPEVAKAAFLWRSSTGVNDLTRDEAEARIKHGAENAFPLSAQDLPHLQGKDLGDALKGARQAWLDGGLKADRDELLRGLVPEAGDTYEMNI